MDKRQRYRDLIDHKVQVLIQANGASDDELASEDFMLKITEAVSDLETVAQTYGLSDNNISNLIQLIVDPSNQKVFKNSVKSTMIKSLYPIRAVSNDIIIKIVGCIGINGLRKRKAFIHKNLQTKLVRWLYLNIAINNIEGFEVLKKLTPMIFNLIDIDYTIQWISSIIFKIIIQFNTSTCFIKSLVKPWRLNMLIELNDKLNDQHLLFLIILFQDLLTESKDSYRLKISRLIRDKRVTSNVFKYPSLNYLSKLTTVKTMNGDSLNLDDDFVENLAFSLQTFDTFKKTFDDKKRKLNAESEGFTDFVSLINSNDENLSIEEFIDHYNHLAMPAQLGAVIFKFADLKQNIIEIGDNLEILTIDTSIYRYLFLVQDHMEEVNEWCEVVLVDDDNSIKITERNWQMVEKIFKGIINIQTILGKTFAISYKILQQTIKLDNETDHVVVDVFKILSQLPLNDDLIKILNSFNWGSSAEYVCQTLRGLIEVFQNSKDYTLINEVYSIVLRKIPNLLIANDYSLTIQLETLNFLQFMTKMSFRDIEISNLILTPGLCYFFLLSNNPTIISEVCKHISFTKNFFAEYYTILVKEKKIEDVERINEFKNLHNSYVMEICNMLWRDKAFEYRENSSSKSMLLPQKFINSLPNITMTIEDDLHIENFFKKSCSIFLSPAFNSIMIKIVRELEDSKECDIRYVGPIEEANFHNFLRELGQSKWIGVSNFEDFKVMLLRELDKTKFNGVSGLLFNSLKSLLNKR